ncbi:hypothetical protein NUW54_g13363 [Trametes sanguinea]|uniref:Uncharacterized protein n=1 Tax=Trametes sanguinea TaxID=158606 RepID=A0ACC1MNZ5_9APHY|nr:hypothetical protein NUW54_g13363 [Trametes sanguinea]
MPISGLALGSSVMGESGTALIPTAAGAGISLPEYVREGFNVLELAALGIASDIDRPGAVPRRQPVLPTPPRVLTGLFTSPKRASTRL